MRLRLVLTFALGWLTACGGAGPGAPETAAGERRAPAATQTPAVVVAPAEAEEAKDATESAPPIVTVEGDGSWGHFHGGMARRGVSGARPIRAPALRSKARVGIQGYKNAPLVVGRVVVVPSSGIVHNTPDPEDGHGARGHE